MSCRNNKLFFRLTKESYQDIDGDAEKRGPRQSLDQIGQS
jgi:hypothetical protein